MRKFLYAAIALGVAISGCSKYSTDPMWFPDSGAIAGVAIKGVTDVVIHRPQFTCAQDTPGPEETTYATSQADYYQTGAFYVGKLDGHPVHGAVCWGAGRPPRVSVVGAPAPVVHTP